MPSVKFRLDPTIVDDAILSHDDDSLEDLPKDIRIALAHKAWIDAKGKLSQNKAARIFGVSPSTLKDRIAGAILKAIASQAMQRLTIAEEDAIRDWILELLSWGWPIRVERLQQLAIELLADKGNIVDLSIYCVVEAIEKAPC